MGQASRLPPACRAFVPLLFAVRMPRLLRSLPAVAIAGLGLSEGDESSDYLRTAWKAAGVMERRGWGECAVPV